MSEGGPRNSDMAFSKNVRFQFLAITAIVLLGYATFYLGWGQMRYSETTIIPMEKFVYWRFALAGLLPLVAYVVTAIFVVSVMFSVMSAKTRRMRFISAVHKVACAVGLAWGLLFAGFEIVTWTECNDPGPKHPECRNREYPAETVADYAFIMMVISSGVMTIGMALGLYMNSMIAITRTGLQISGGVDIEYLGARFMGFGKKKSKKDKKHKKNKWGKKRQDDVSMDFIDSQGSN